MRLALFLPACLPLMSLQAATLVFIGTGSRHSGEGIYASWLDAESGALSSPRLAVAADRPGFLALHPDGRHLYAIGEGSPAAASPDGVVRAYAIDRTSGRLTLLNEVSSGGLGPCHISLDRAGTWAFVANYTGGTVASFRIQPDGTLGGPVARAAYSGSSVHPRRQDRPHAHSANLDPSGRRLLVADLGTDRLMLHRFDPADGSLVPDEPAFVSIAPGSGPRHLAFAPSGRFLYLLNELTSTIAVLAGDAEAGTFRPRQTITMLPSDFSGSNTGAEVVVHPTGRFVYASNRGHDSIAVFGVDAATGRLAPLGHQSTGGRTPRNFALAPGGRWLLAANQDSNTIVVLAVDPATGQLSRRAGEIQVPVPTCVRFLVVD